MEVYVVYSWRDYRKENGANILGVYRREEIAMSNMKKFAEEYAKEYEAKDIEKGTPIFGLPFYNVIVTDEDYQVFQIDKMIIED